MMRLHSVRALALALCAVALLGGAAAQASSGWCEGENWELLPEVSRVAQTGCKHASAGQRCMHGRRTGGVQVASPSGRRGTRPAGGPDASPSPTCPHGSHPALQLEPGLPDIPGDVLNATQRVRRGSTEGMGGASASRPQL